MPKNEKPLHELYPRESSLSITVLPHETEEDRQALEEACNYWLKAQEEAKRPRAIQWFTNAAFLVGQHYNNWFWNGSTLDSATSPTMRNPNRASAHIPKTADNRLIRPFETNVSILTQDNPIPRVIPNSERPEDDDAAKLSEIVHNLLWESPLGMPEKLRQVAALICMTGTAAVEVSYEESDIPKLADETKTEKDTDPITGEELERVVPTGKKVPVFGSDIKAKVFNAFQLSPDPAATADPDTLNWIARTTFEDRGWVYETFNRDEAGYYPENLENMGGDGKTDYVLYWWSRVNDLLDSPNSGMMQTYGLTNSKNASNGACGPNQVAFTVIDCKPNKHNPSGRTLVLAGGKLIYCGPARAWSEKYSWRWHPYAISRFWTVPGRFWGIPLLSELVPLQRRINAIDSLIQINREFLTFGSWLIPIQSRIKDGYISHIPGQQIEYRSTPGAAKPERIDNPPLPAELINERATLIDAIERLAGTNNVLEGASTSGIRAGVMLDFLKRESLASKDAVLQAFSEFLQGISQNILIEVNLNMIEPNSELTRRVKAAARDFSNLSIDTFTAADLRDNVEVKIDIRSGLMSTPEARAERAATYMQTVGPNMTPQERTLVAKAMGIDVYDKQNSPQVTRARRMVSRIASGMLEAALPLPVDDPNIFAEVLRTEILADKFQDYSNEIKSKILDLFEHYKGLSEQMAMAQAQQAAAMSQAGVQPEATTKIMNRENTNPAAPGQEQANK